MCAMNLLIIICFAIFVSAPIVEKRDFIDGHFYTLGRERETVEIPFEFEFSS